MGCAAAAFAFESLPAGGQVNDDPAAGINPALSVGGEDPANADVTGGALTAGQPAVPWAIFRQQENGGARDQVFARSFAGGTWTTRGSGTVGGRSSATPVFSGSLNFDQGQDGEAPSIDFAGAGRTVPWAGWYEDTTGTGFGGVGNIFVSRFDNSGDANQGKWIFAGQGRGNGGGTVPVPSLNIHTDQNAENPSIAGGSAADPTKPAPWVTWQETTTSPVNGKDQIFVDKGLGPGTTNCTGVTPGGSASTPDGGFCWQDVGTPRVGPAAADPSLNVDPTRNALEPDIAFTGAQDSVPWVVWYETGTGSPNGLATNAMVFAAKAVSDPTADGGFRWEVVGNQLHGALGTGGTNGFGSCGESAASEVGCSLNHETSRFAEDPRVAAGTMSAEHSTTPWVVWDEGSGESGVRQVFVSRLVGVGSAAHFEIVNGGLPISTGTGTATRPDITFSGNTPYVSWRQDVGGGVEKGFFGHFVDAAAPSFVLDESDVPLSPRSQADVREPLSSSCAATPFNGDGATCQGGALGTPFFLSTNGTSPRGLFADSYQPGTPVTGAASDGSASSATLNGTVDPLGAPVKVSFQYGTTTAYGSAAAAGSIGVGNSPMPFSAQLTGLTTGTTIHYRAVATSDFGRVAGADQTLTVGASTKGPPSAKVSQAKASGTQASVGVSCPAPGTNSCRLRLELTVTEKLKGHRVLAVSARAKHGPKRKTVVVGSASATLAGGQLKVLQVGLNGKGKQLLKRHSPLKTRLVVTQEGIKTPISTQTVTFRLPKHRRS